jgi:multiple antibiotic resistance protein
MFDWSELLNWTEYTKLLFGLIAITAPLGATPVFIGYVGHMEKKQQNLAALVTVSAYIVLLTIFTFLGEAILAFFGITLAAFQVAGGLLLLVSALDMLRSDIDTDTAETDKSDNVNPISIAIAPLAIPLLAGPGAISTIMIYAGIHSSSEHSILLTLAILTVAVIVFIAFRGALKMGNIFNATTMIIANRIMGMIIASIAIEFIMDGIAGHFPQLMILH